MELAKALTAVRPRPSDSLYGAGELMPPAHTPTPSRSLPRVRGRFGRGRPWSSASAVASDGGPHGVKGEVTLWSFTADGNRQGLRAAGGGWKARRTLARDRIGCGPPRPSGGGGLSCGLHDRRTCWPSGYTP